MYVLHLDSLIFTNLNKLIKNRCLLKKIILLLPKDPLSSTNIIYVLSVLRKESLNSDGQQFYQYQQNEPPPGKYQIIELKTLPIEIQVLAYDRHKNVARLGLLVLYGICFRLYKLALKGLNDQID